MNVALEDQILENMRKKTTDELLQIWQTNDQSQWSDSAFGAIKQVLTERGISAVPSTYVVNAAPSYKGVRGWLLFFCIVLAILTPLSNFAQAGALDTASGGLPLAFRIFVLAISAFAVYAGIGLWRVAPRAVWRAKAFLWTNLACGALLAVLLAIGGHTFIKADVVDLARSLAFFTIWYSYLNLSKRVKDTYGLPS